MKVVDKPQPLGEQGVRFSLDEVARRATEGSRNALVRRWAIEQLANARDGGQTTRKEITRSNLARARILLKSVQKKLWVPDPVATEFMQGGHLTACVGDKKDCFHGGDCDDLVILTASAFSSVGIPTLVVGHAYNTRRALEHVLAAVWGEDDVWHYADPSTEWELGRCANFTRERVIAIPSGEVVCDADVCVRGGNIKPDVVEPENTGGRFVGVDGPPTGALVWIVKNR